MSDGPLAPVDPNEPLQFDNAEYTNEQTGRLTCAACHQEVEHTYYEMNGQTVCDRCRILIESQMVGGSRFVRLARATLFGSIAALAGFAIYFGILKLTGWEIGLISVLVGFMVGSAVRTGSRHRGGWVYQGLAVFLTYSAIAASYSATILPEWFAEGAAGARVEKKEGNEAARAIGEAAGHRGDAKQDPDLKPEDVLAARVGAKPAPDQAPASGKAATALADPKEVKSVPGDAAKARDIAEQDLEPGPDPMPKNASEAILLALMFVAAVVALSYSLPIIAGLASPVGLIIVGFALWEAWKLNRRVTLVFNGPFVIGGDSAPPPMELPRHA